jgi:TolB protein
VTPEPLPLADDEFIVAAASLRTETGLQVAAGQEIFIEFLSGGWRGGPSPTWPVVGPEGDPQVSSKSTFPVPDSPVMTLIAGVGSGEPVSISAGASFVSDSGGELWIGPNDDDASDNDGELRVRVTLGDVQVSIIPLAGDGVMQLSFGPERDYTPALSPDQSRLIYASEIGDDWILVEGDVNGSEEAFQLTPSGINVQAPDFSPDGQSLLASSDQDGDYDIYLLDSRSGEIMAQLTDMPGDEYSPHWLRDGSGFVFSWMNNDVEGIYLQDMAGAQTELVRSTAFEGFAWPSPDGRQVAFYSGRDGDYEIYVMDSDGGNPRRLTTSSGRDASPTWSPDGAWIAFESARNGDYDIYVMRADGSELRQLTSGDDNEWFPAFSPDGQWLLFQSDRTGGMDIYRVPFAP